MMNMSKKMGRSTRNISQSYLYCPKCGNENHIQRRKKLLKSNGHIKDLWCHVCKETTKHVEKRQDQVYHEKYLEKIWENKEAN